MNPFLRRKTVSALMIMRSKNLTLPVNSLIFFFKLFSVQDKEVRKMITSHVVNDIKRINKHHKNVNINKQIQNFIFEILKKNSDALGKRAIQIMI